MRSLHHLSRLFRPRGAGHGPSAPLRPPPPRQPQQPPRPTRRYNSTKPNPNNPSSTSQSPPPPPPGSTATTTRAERILARLPRPLQRYAARLRGAPLTHVAAFLVLHEITAVVPLLGLFGLFHYTEHAPVASYMLAHYGGYVRDGVGRFERYFRRKGWFGFGREEGTEEEEEVVVVEEEGNGLEKWEADPKYRVVVDIALAYAVTKVLLPVRIVASVWATPWFAGVLMRLRRVVGRSG